MQTEVPGPAPTAQAQVMQMVMGAWVSQTISSVTRLNVPDILHTHGPLTAYQIAERSDTAMRPDYLERALRACAGFGLFVEYPSGRFGPTPLSEVLTSRSPASVKKFVECFGGTWWRVWSGLSDAVQTGEPQATAQLGADYWDYCRANPKEMEDFGEAMKANSLRTIKGVLEHCDLSGVGSIVDVGGGLGHLAIALAERYPGLRAIVLDLPDLEPIARAYADKHAEAVRDRVTYVGGDMFESVPDADAYVLKHIVHDWDDAHCISVLRNCCRSLRPQGRVLCVDAVLPPLGDASGAPAKLLDLNMMVFHPGRERTEAQWRSLYEAAGLAVVDVIPIGDHFGTSIVVGARR